MWIMIVSRADSLQGTIQVPGDKSISHRAAILSAMAEGETRIENFSTAQDCHTTLKCLADLGVPISSKGTEVVVSGVGKTGFRAPRGPLDCGNSGTTARLLAGVLAGQSFDSVLTGDASLAARPMGRIIEPLIQMGAKIDSADGRLPITISGRHKLKGVEHHLQVASAQVKSCLLLAGLLAEGRTTVIESVTTRDHTGRMLSWLDIDAGAGQILSTSYEQVLAAKHIHVPGDISSASFFMVAAACLRDSDLIIPNVGVNPTRSTIIDVLKHIGVGWDIADRSEVCNEPRATIRIRGPINNNNDGPTVLDGDVIPSIIDEIPILAILGTQIKGGLEIRDASELRYKETDRIAAVVENLRRMGAAAEEFPDGLKVHRSDLGGAVVDSFGDHRVAMAFAVAGLLAEGETEIMKAECVDISFPAFFDTLATVVR